MRGAILVVILAAHVLLLLFFSGVRRPVAQDAGAVLATMFFVPPEPEDSWRAPLLYRSNTPLPTSRARQARAPTPPPPNDPQQQPPTPDWHAQLEQSANQQVQQLIAAERRDNALTASFNPMVTSAAPPGKPRIPWDYAATHRLQTVPGVGILYNFNDRCTLLISFFPFVSCKIGKL